MNEPRRKAATGDNNAFGSATPRFAVVQAAVKKRVFFRNGGPRSGGARRSRVSLDELASDLSLILSFVEKTTRDAFSFFIEIEFPNEVIPELGERREVLLSKLNPSDTSAEVT